MDDISTLLIFSFTMLIGCYLFGSIPLALTLSDEKLKLVSTIGSGLLIGTALSIIIPEGVHNIYSASTYKHSHSNLNQQRSLMAAVEIEKPSILLLKKNKDGSVLETEQNYNTEKHSFIGVALVLGFIFMLIVDQLGCRHVHHHNPDFEPSNVLHSHRNNITATVGLVVHSAADGLALGAAATTSDAHVEVIVFLAIMLHKAPAAFGLVSFLLHEGFDRTRIRKHLALFSVSAPLTAILSFFCLSQGSKDALSEINATGIAMLFSAGTFLYVATVHILWELATVTTVTTSSEGVKTFRDSKEFSKIQVVLLVIGALLPLILSFSHHH